MLLIGRLDRQISGRTSRSADTFETRIGTAGWREVGTTSATVVVGTGVGGCPSRTASPRSTTSSCWTARASRRARRAAPSGLLTPTRFSGEHPDAVLRHARLRVHRATTLRLRPRCDAEAARDRADTLAADGFPVSYFAPATRTSIWTPRRRAAVGIGGFARVNPVFQRSFGYLPLEAKVYSFLARAFGR